MEGKERAHVAESRRCSDDICELLLPLSQKYPPHILFAALALTTGSRFAVALEFGLCSEPEARALIQRMKDIAFPPDDDPAAYPVPLANAC